MARPVRINVRDGIYHVMSRGDNRKMIFHDDRDGGHFEELLSEMSERFRVKILAYVAMINHYHLMIQTPEANCSAAIQWLNIAYGMWHNKRHRCCGHVFQGRFGSVLVEKGVWVLEMSVYIHLNPVAVKVLGLGTRETGETSAKRRIVAGLESGRSGKAIGNVEETSLEFVWCLGRLSAPAGMVEVGMDGRESERRM